MTASRGVVFRSGGHRLIGTLYLARDVAAAVDHLQAGGYQGVDQARFAAVGHSLGGTDDRWVPPEQARSLYAHGRGPCRYAEIEGANHDFAWHRAELRELVTSWLTEADV
jgi:pimeloyl-ACP methyl ester carboxylesterase